MLFISLLHSYIVHSARDMIVNERPDDDDKEAINKFLNVELILDVSTNNEHQGQVEK